MNSCRTETSSLEVCGLFSQKKFYLPVMAFSLQWSPLTQAAQRRGSGGPADVCDLWLSSTLAQKPLNPQGREEPLSAAVGEDMYLTLVRGFLLFYIHSISMQLTKAGLKCRLGKCPMVDSIQCNSQGVRSCGSTGSSGTAAILPGTGVCELQFNQHQQSVLPTLPFFM